MKIIKRRGKKKLYRQFQIMKKTICNIDEINFYEFREDNTYEANLPIPVEQLNLFKS